MTRDPKLGMAMAAGLLGIQQHSSVGGAFALALVMHTLAPWQPPTGRALRRARKTAARYKLADDLAIFLPPEPGMFAGREVREGYQALVVALKHLDALDGEERGRTIAEVKTLLGAA